MTNLSREELEQIASNLFIALLIEASLKKVDTSSGIDEGVRKHVAMHSGKLKILMQLIDTYTQAKVDEAISESTSKQIQYNPIAARNPNLTEENI